jgi:HlyD family secretion protein
VKNNKNMTGRRWLWLGLLVLGVGSGLSGCNGNESGGLILSGTVEARETAVAFQVNGRIERLLVDEGEPVKQGQEVALLAADDYEQAVTRAKAEVAAAEASVAVLEAGARKQELKVAEATLGQARAEQRFAEEEVQRSRSLIAKKLASQEQLDQAQLKRDVANAAVRRAQQQLQLLQEGPRQEDIDKARAELAARRSALKTAEQQLSYTHLVSPVSGTVTLRQAEAGEVVGPGQPVFKVAELTRPWVRAYLNETDLARVRLGQKVTVTVDGLPGKSFPGTLSFISPKAEFTPKSVETRALRVDLVYRVKVQLEDPEGVLKLGMPADVVFDSRT